MRVFILCIISILFVGCSPKYYKSKKGRNGAVISRRHIPTNNKGKRIRATPVEPKITRPPTERNPEVLVATSAVKVTPAVIRQYIEQYKDIAMVEMQRYNIPASITLAQAILESGSGQGRLARYAHNHFGIKCHSSWEGASIYHDDDENDECFRKYQHPNESFEDHSLFLVNRSRYAALFELESTDYKGWAHGLRKAGYATDPKYPNKLIYLINKYDLHQYDLMVLGNQVQTSAKPLPNNMYIVKAGDTLYGISREVGVSVEKLMEMNNLSDTNLQVGQALQIAL